MSARLGCGAYRVILHARDDLTRPLAELPYTSLEWGRVVDDTSEAKVTVGAEGCCGPVASLLPWATTLALYRAVGGEGAPRCWSGPLVNVKPGSGVVVFTARDLSAWLDRRLVHGDQIHAGADLADIFQAFFDDAMAPDPVPDFTLTVQPTGTDGDREVLAEQHRMAGDEMRELSRTGLDWTVVDRVMLAGGEEVPTPPVATLIDSHFAELPDPERDGLAQANHWVVQGSGGGAEGDEVVGEATAAPGPEGLLEQVVSESAILDSPSADVAAQTRVESSAAAPLMISGGQLLAEAPLPIELAVPGARVRLALSGTCIPVLDIRRLVALRVTADAAGGERVSIELSPLGTAAVVDEGAFLIGAAVSYAAPPGVNPSVVGGGAGTLDLAPAASYSPPPGVNPSSGSGAGPVDIAPASSYALPAGVNPSAVIPPPSGLTYGFIPGGDETAGIIVGDALGFTMMRSHDKGYNQSTASMEARILQAAQAGIETQIMIGFDGIPPNAGTIGAMAARFGPGGTFWNSGQPGAGLGALATRYIELGNENSYSYSPKPGLTAGTAYAMYAHQCYDAVQIANPAVGLLIQADDSSQSGGEEWVNRMFNEWPGIGGAAAGWVIHPYGPPADATTRINRMISQLGARGVSNPPIFVTEDGLSTDNGNNLNDNYGWPTNLTYSQAATSWQTKLDMYAARSDVVIVYRYKAADQAASGSGQREDYFGMRKSDNVTNKGALTTVEINFAAAHPRS